VRVELPDDEPVGLARMLADLIEQNLARDPSRRRLLKSAVVAITATDAGVSVTLHIGRGTVTIRNGAAPQAPVHIQAAGGRLFGLAACPLRFGLPDLFSREGRAIAGDLIRGRTRIDGLILHLPAVRRLTMLLSAF
jgi:hypothetical protein